MKIIQTIIDAITVVVAGLVATWLRFDSGLFPAFHDAPPPYGLYVNGALIAAVIVTLLLHALHMYEKPGAKRILAAGLIGAGIAFVIAFLIRTDPPISRLVLLLYVALLPTLLLIERAALSAVMNARSADT